MHSPNITTIVVNWNLKRETARCIAALAQSTYPCRNVLVDNGSVDGSVEHLASRFPDLTIISLPENIGFGRACNRAILQTLAETDTDFIFLLNNDTVVHPMALSRLAETARANPQASILGPKIYFLDNRRIWYAGARCRRGVLAASDVGRGQIDFGQYGQIRPVDYVFGAAMFVHRSVFEKIGLFDERYFLYLEDLDFCLRARNAGFTLLFVPQAQIWHTGSASTCDNQALRRYHHIRSTILFLQKNVPFLSLLPALAFWIAVLLRTLLVDLLHGNFRTIASTWSGLVNGVAEARRCVT